MSDIYKKKANKYRYKYKILKKKYIGEGGDIKIIEDFFKSSGTFIKSSGTFINDIISGKSFQNNQTNTNVHELNSQKQTENEFLKKIEEDNDIDFIIKSIEYHNNKILELGNLKNILCTKHKDLIKKIKIYNLVDIDSLYIFLNENEKLLNKTDKSLIYFIKLTNETITTLKEQIQKLENEEDIYLNNINSKTINLEKILEQNENFLGIISKDKNKILFKNIIIKRIQVIKNAIQQDINNQLNRLKYINEQILKTIDTRILDNFSNEIDTYKEYDETNELKNKIKNIIDNLTPIIALYNYVEKHFDNANINKLIEWKRIIDNKINENIINQSIIISNIRILQNKINSKINILNNIVTSNAFLV